MESIFQLIIKLYIEFIVWSIKLTLQIIAWPIQRIFQFISQLIVYFLNNSYARVLFLKTMLGLGLLWMGIIAVEILFNGFMTLMGELGKWFNNNPNAPLILAGISGVVILSGVGVVLIMRPTGRWSLFAPFRNFVSWLRWSNLSFPWGNNNDINIDIIDDDKDDLSEQIKIL